MFQQIEQHLPFEQFADPNKRIYWPYLAICTAYALAFILFSRIKIRKTGINYWFSHSSLIDWVTWTANHILQLTLLPLLFTNSLAIASAVYQSLNSALGEYKTAAGLPDWGIIWYAVSYFFISDFTRYLLHYAMHHNKFLWSIHRMHHTAEVLTPITFFRVHPFEMIFSHLRFLLVHGFITGLFIYLYHDVYDFPKIFGASFFVFISNILGGNLRHSHIPIGFGVLEYIFVSPKQHQMHHSRETELQQTNYGSLFAFWDFVFRTWKPSKGVNEINYGVAGPHRQSFVGDLFYPFRQLIKRQRDKEVSAEYVPESQTKKDGLKDSGLQKGEK